MKYFLSLIILIVVIITAACTRQVYVPVETVRTEYREADTTAIFNRLLKIFESKRENEVRSDSLVDRENVTVVLNVLGDTVKELKTKYVYRATKREKELERKINERDSIINGLRTRLSSVKTDSVAVPYPVERELSRWEKAKMDFGGMAMGGAGVLFIGLCIAVVWIIRKRRKNI